MSNPTSNFNWQMPTNSDLVTDLPADFEVFGQAVDTSMADLIGVTTGQILSKATNTDMDFVWIANDQGDITGITATSPLTGGGTSGAVTVGIQASSTTQSGAVQLSDSTSTTSSVLAATPTAVKSAYDLAAAAVPKSTVTTAGDVIYATGSSAVTRLGIGTAGQVLTVNGGATAPSWSTPAATASGLTLVKTQTIGSAVSSVTVTSAFSATYDSYLITISGGVTSVSNQLNLTLGSTVTGYAWYEMYHDYTAGNPNGGGATGLTSFGAGAYGTTSSISGQFTLQNPNAAKYTHFYSNAAASAGSANTRWAAGYLADTTAYTAFTLTATGGTMTGGTIRVYGYQNS
jgi:hypothetical protein